MTPAAAPAVSVVIATQRRPRPLTVAMRSTMRQRDVDPQTLELVVVDNDVTPSARSVVEALAAESPFPVRYVHEPQPGVASARNAAVAVAQGALIAFLDDDQEASDGWLAALLSTRNKLSADAVFGPVRGAVPADIRRHRRYFERFFTHPGPDIETLVPRGFGAGVCLIVRAALPDPDRPFSTARDFTGGEDDALFAAMLAAGRRLAWNPAAWVWEHPARARITLGYAMRRTFVYGQGGTNKFMLVTPPRRAAAALSVATGAVQALGFGGLSLGCWCLRMGDRAFVYDKAMRGLGKVFFGPRFRLQFYGLRAGETAGRSLWKARPRPTPRDLK